MNDLTARAMGHKDSEQEIQENSQSDSCLHQHDWETAEANLQALLKAHLTGDKALQDEITRKMLNQQTA